MQLVVQKKILSSIWYNKKIAFINFVSRIRGQELLNEILVHLIWLQILQLIRNQTQFQEETVPVAGGKDWKGINPIITSSYR